MKNEMIDVNEYAGVREAVEAVAKRGGGAIRFPAGVYESATIHLPSHIHLRFEEGAVLQAAETGFDEPEPTEWSAYQDFGHSHFDNSLLVAKDVEDITLSGPGLITGAGRLGAHDDGHGGKGGKLIALKEARNVVIRDLTLAEGGHFTLLANGVDGMEVSNVRIEGQRDGFNVIGCKNVLIRDSWIEGGDDALVFKSDYALGRVADSENVEVRDCDLKSKNNALQFGTETVGAFRNMRFDGIRCVRAGKAAVGILSCDGAVIEDIHFRDMVLEECPTFFFIKIADRGRRPGYEKGRDTGVIRRISFTNVEGRGPMTSRGLELTPTLMGMPHRFIEDISFTNVHLTVHGGHPAEDADVRVEDTGFFFSRFHNDVHPSHGWWMRHVANVTFTDCGVRCAQPDGRPAVAVEESRRVTFRNFTAEGTEPLNREVRVIDSEDCGVEASPGVDRVEAEPTAAQRIRALFRGFENNKREFSQAPFWFWNDALAMREISRQIDDFKLHGVYAFVIHPRAGLPRDQGWMSEEFLEMMRYAIDQATGRDMWVILYDDAMYPSGSSGGQVVEENPAYACRGFVQVDLDEASPGETVRTVKVGPEGVELADNQTLVAEVRRQSDGHRLAIVDTPVGSHIRGVHFVEDYPPRREDHKEVEEIHPPAADLLNPEAMRCFIRLVYEKFYDRFGSHFGSTIRAIFTDEPHIPGRGGYPGLDARPGTTGILEHVNAFLGYDFTPHLPCLWSDDEPDAKRHRSDYNRAIQHRLRETYYKPISDWCEAHGIALTGHPAASDDIGLLRYFQIPGQDVVLRCIEPGKPSVLTGVHSTMGKCASSAMLHRNRRRNLNEFAGAYGHELTFREYRWLALWLLIRGCNLLSPHAFYYSIRGPRIDERPRDVGPNSPWWDDYKPFAEMTGRLCWLNTDSVPICEVAILGQANRLPWESAKVCFENQIDFNYLEEEFLTRDSAVTEEGIAVGPMRYTTLVVEEGFETTPGSDAEAALERLAFAGRLVRWSPEAGESALRNALPAPVSVVPAHAGLRVRRVRKDGKMYVTLFNEGETPFVGKVEVEGLSGGILVDMDRNEVHPREPGLELELEPHACRVLAQGEAG